MIYIPTDRDFGADFLKAEALQSLGERIIQDKLPDLDDGELIIDYAWKARGGASGGNSILGKCVKLSGPARYFALGSHFLVWLGADNCRARNFNDQQIEALLYHELLHIVREEKVDEEGNLLGITYKTRGHDIELFYDEIKEYGLWRDSLKQLSEVVQAALPGFEPALVATP